MSSIPVVHVGVTLNPALHLGLDKTLGRIETGLSADLFAFRITKGFGLDNKVWVEGRNVFDLAGRTIGPACTI